MDFSIESTYAVESVTSRYASCMVSYSSNVFYLPTTRKHRLQFDLLSMAIER